MSDKITMSLCEEANHLKPQRRTTYIDAEQFKYLYGDYYSKKFMKNVDDDCSFTIKYYYKEDREERKGADSVWCDMYWSIDNADMPNADQFEEECNRIKYYPYNGSSGIALMMCGLDFVDEEDEEEEEEEKDDGSNTCNAVETRTQKTFIMAEGYWNYIVVFDDDGEQKKVYMETNNGLELCEDQRLVITYNKHGDQRIKCVYNHYELNEDRDECWITNC